MTAPRSIPIPRGLGTGTIIELNPETGEGLNALMLTGDAQNPVFNSFAFHEGTLYANDSAQSGGASRLLTIDLMTGQATFVGNLPDGVDALTSNTPNPVTE